ncbi:hypothetical protein M595_5755 [Lyngbya aestuarii BL J]|uniref:Uncharacterized protein n=1 Tax=Lyngbya aestuarii BL J TaxID=1348334 RepID=U7QB91_9CYAN|nr:hypothetical protein [Lyngbya aestuarii]ERT04310.1 hypothetical protein M595_5755 [Lyngbya aestuarii BL J]
MSYQAIISRADSSFRKDVEEMFFPVSSNGDIEEMKALYKKSDRDDNDPIYFMHRLELKDGFELRNAEDINQEEEDMTDEDCALLVENIFSKKKYEKEELENFDIITVWYKVYFLKYFPQTQIVEEETEEFPLFIILLNNEYQSWDCNPENYIDHTIWEDM